MNLSYFEQREIHNQTRLDELKNFISQMDSIREIGDLCIYATGSYARREASKHSDLDLFFY
jgi:predicted nucleotidyltransferase